VDLEGGFRYLADLDPAVAGPLAYPAASWSADSQRLLFVAPRQRPPAPTLGWSLQPDARLALYVATSVDTAPLLLGDTDVDRATWREDGQMLGLGRGGGDGTLALRLLSGANGTSQQLLQLPLKPLSRYAAAWDVGHARLLIASSAGSGAVDYWLALLGLEGVS
jgi:hypothetical protein